MPKFKVSDAVEAFGIPGRVYEVDSNFVSVALQNGEFMEFLPDGRLNEWHATASLQLLGRPDTRKKIKLFIAIKDKTAQHAAYARETSYAYESPHRAEGFWSASHQIVEVEIYEEIEG